MMKNLNDKHRFVTQAIHGGRVAESTAVPIYQGVNAPRASGNTDYVSDFGGSGGPTIASLESLMMTLEEARWSLATSTGIGAISLLFLSVLNQGDRIIAHRCIYSLATRLLNDELSQKMGLDICWVDMRDLNALENALEMPTRLVYFEPIANPAMHLLDVKAITKLGHEAGAIVAVDNTLLSPYLLRPLNLGVDLVIHSATKYLGGHGDALAGIISGNRDDLNQNLMRMRTLLGLFLAPMNAFLIIRGIRTLPFRMPQHCQNAAELARFLRHQDWVTAVRYPGLESFEATQSAQSQQKAFGALLGCILADGVDPEEFRQQLKLCRPWGSLGDVETLVAVPSTGELRDVPPNFLRVAVGLEDIEDVKADFLQAYNALKS
ncbi:MAG: PLP-dependent aspartate aminotransferase family protein [Chloroflexota bacterium]